MVPLFIRELYQLALLRRYALPKSITGLCPEPRRYDRYPINGAPLRSSLAPEGAFYWHAEVARVFTAGILMPAARAAGL